MPLQVARELWGANAGEALSNLGLTRLTAAVSVIGSRVNAGELAHTVMAYDSSSNLVQVCDDNGHKTTHTYDALNRIVTTTDDEGSTLTRVYDKAGNVIRTTEVDLDVAGYAAGTFHTETFFDALNRPIATVSNLGNTQRFLYDSRGLLAQASDALGTVTGTISQLPSAAEHGTFPQGGSLTINRRGNTSRFSYDGLGRQLTSIRDLRQDGTGASVVVGQIATSQTYDDNGRVAQRFDPSGNVTGYVYDHQDRLIREVFADGTDRRFVWVDNFANPDNRTSTIKTELDARGVAKAFTYDAMERPSDVAITGRPPGAGQTTFQAFDFDGLGRRTKGEDDDSRVEAWFDSMSRSVKETQTVEVGTPRTSKAQAFSGAAVARDVLRASDGVGNLIKLTYPSGQAFERRYDGVDRLASVKQGFVSPTPLATFNHAGLGARRMSRTYQAGGVDVMSQALEYDGDRRVLSLEARVITGAVRIRGFGYAWDRANNRRWERRLSGTYQDEGTGVGEAYRYDSAYRLVHDDKDVADVALDAISTNATNVPAAPFVAANASDYVLDAASNRRQTTIAGVTQAYALDPAAQTRDLPMNQYTFVGSAARAHDAMGNLVGQSDTGRQAFYDADSRLVQWTEGSKDVRYRYDVDGRRTVKEDVGTASFPRTLFFWDGWQTVEETNSAGALQKQYVWGAGIDECLKANLPDAADIDGDSNTTEKVDLYYHHNSLGSVVAVTDAAGAVKESYRYSAFGAPTVFNAAGTQVAATVVKQPFLFTGARCDFEEGSGLYQMRLRYYDPVVGRFMSRDPLGLWGDPSQAGNGQGYCGHDPVNRIDPLGLLPVVVVQINDKNASDAISDEARKQVADYFRTAFAGRTAPDGSTVGPEGVEIRFKGPGEGLRLNTGWSSDGSELVINAGVSTERPGPGADNSSPGRNGETNVDSRSIVLFLKNLADLVDAASEGGVDGEILKVFDHGFAGVIERIIDATGGLCPTDEQLKRREFLRWQTYDEPKRLFLENMKRQWLEQHGTPNIDSAIASVMIHELWHAITQRGHDDSPGSVSGKDSPFLEANKGRLEQAAPPRADGSRHLGYSDPTKDAILRVLSGH